MFLEEAFRLKEHTIANRRYIHSNAETGMDLPKTVAFVRSELESYGYTVSSVGGGLTCTCGSGTPVILLRADMDALNQEEQTGLPYACQTGACHSCGHDAHTAMLLSAAQILKKHSSELSGTVKFMFQPGEETLQGAQRMIDEGILENPKVDVAMGLHMNFGPCGEHDIHAGSIAYCADRMAFSSDAFQITVTGESAHSASAYQGVSAINVASAIITALQQIISLEIPSDEPVIISIGQVSGGEAFNIVPSRAIIRGNFRSYSAKYRKYLKKRVEEISVGIAHVWRSEASVDYIGGVDPYNNDPALTLEMGQYCGEVMKKVQIIPPIKASEDFANLCKFVPTFFANICAGDPSDGYLYAMHNPKARLDENALPYGVAVHCTCAFKWLANHCK